MTLKSRAENISRLIKICEKKMLHVCIKFFLKERSLDQLCMIMNCAVH